MSGAWRQVRAIARKELGAYFGSPMALIFVGVFLVITLFSFFWIETFFARQIADLRPLFRWMPALMIFLVSALAMRQWSEEQRSGTLEVLFTLPIRRSLLVLGKFLAVMALICVALALTLFLPITVAVLGNLDWGPVVGGYLATVLMASAYVAIGLFVSSRTDNQIVALIVTVIMCGAFYLVGSSSLTELTGRTAAEILRAFGTGSRFESIERGVIDLRDLIYYLSLTAVFLLLNVLSLDSKGWSRGVRTLAHRRNAALSVGLVALNLLALNAWLFPVRALRADLTSQKEYSLSSTTREIINNLPEPLLLRGYFSQRTHPLLAPLLPTIRDLMKEYEILSGGKVRVEIVDPRDNAKVEEEATQAYGINPTPFRITEKYEAAVVNSYFDILVRYGNQYAHLGFGDIIETEDRPDGQVDVRLRNLEYDLTRSIKKVVYGFQSIDVVFQNMRDPVRLSVYITPNSLPETLKDAPKNIESVAKSIQAVSGGKFEYEIIDPDAPAAKVTRQMLADDYGLQPYAESPFSPKSYYLELLLRIGSETQTLYPTGQLAEADIRSEIEGALKRAVPGFTKTVGIWYPSEDPIPNMYGGTSDPLSTWKMARAQLSQNYLVKRVDLRTGRVPGDVNVLVLIGPQNLIDRERFAIDQFLMRGGAVVVAAGKYVISPMQFGGGIMLDPVQSGVMELLEFYGIKVGDSMVMDTRNEPFPTQRYRNVGGTSVAELQQVAYPFFVDVRRDSMAPNNPIVSNLPAVTLQWASPIELDPDKNQGREVTELLKSSKESWLNTTADTEPDLDTYPDLGFPIEGEQKPRLLAVAVRGNFESYFNTHEVHNPDEGVDPYLNPQGPPTTPTPEPPLPETVKSSPESARLVVIGSTEFLDDAILGVSQRLSADRYLLNLQLLQNAVDWSVEEEDLLSIRSRGTYTRLLKSMKKGQQSFWEIANYAVALIGVVAIGGVWSLRRRNEVPMKLSPAKSGDRL